VDNYVDSYCERLAPGFWGEPLNAVSNLAFLIAAVATFLLARRAARATGRPAIIGYVLAGLIGLIFLGSAAFHTTATRWGAALDSGFIAVFLLYYIVVFTHLFWGVPWRLAWIAAPVFLGFTAVVGVTIGLLLRGPGTYAAALLGLFILGASLRRSRLPERRRHWRPFILAGTVFTVSLTLRTLDDPVCASLPIGTHFLWHLLNACTLFIVARVAIIRWREVNTTRRVAAGSERD
jgi:hypothetical protein